MNKLLSNIRDINLSPRQQILSMVTDSKDYFTPKKAALIFCNSYYGTKMDLGDCAINDGILCHEKFQKLGYQPFLFYDITCEEFRKILKDFCGYNFTNFVVYFIGHGTQTKDKNGDEEDGMDEMIVFKDGYIVDDELNKIIKTSKSKKIVLMSDCCHSGSIWDKFDEKSDIVTISACMDSQCAAQYYFDRKGNGCFTYYFWKYYDLYKNNLEMAIQKINEKLVPFKQHCVSNKNKISSLF